MSSQVPDQPRPRTYILGRRFRMRPRDQAVGVMVQKKEFFPMPHIGWNTGRPTATSRTIFGFRMPPVIPALWHSLTTTQPGGFIVCNFRRVKGVFNNFRDLWNDFCLWSSHRQFRELEPRPFAFSERDQKHWRGLKAGQYQIAYQDPSADPKWRMKQIIEVKDYSDLDHAFHVYCANMTWTWRNREFGSADWRFHMPHRPGYFVPTVDEPLW